VTQIPDLELDLFTNTVDPAVSRADRGDVAGGHDELLYGLERAEAARDAAEAWGAELVGHWTRALERFAREYRIGRA
jgi:hypothetical protein